MNSRLHSHFRSSVFFLSRVYLPLFSFFPFLSYICCFLSTFCSSPSSFYILLFFSFLINLVYFLIIFFLVLMYFPSFSLFFFLHFLILIFYILYSILSISRKPWHVEKLFSPLDIINPAFYVLVITLLSRKLDISNFF